MNLSSVVYIRDNDKILMLHRTKKENDLNEGKWLGLGGRVEAKESPMEAARREVLEESSLILDELIYQGLMTFNYEDRETEYIFVYRGTLPEHLDDLVEEAKSFDSPEGELEWINIEEVLNLDLWEGDRLFLPYILDESDELFSLKLNYDFQDNLLDYIFEH